MEKLLSHHPLISISWLLIDYMALTRQPILYEAESLTTTVSFLEVTFASPGNKQFRLQIMCNDPSSNLYALANYTFSVKKMN